jgi:ATP-dependent Clp protease ATP-binding subunit ClpX
MICLRCKKEGISGTVYGEEICEECEKELNSTCKFCEGKLEGGNTENICNKCKQYYLSSFQLLDFINGVGREIAVKQEPQQDIKQNIQMTLSPKEIYKELEKHVIGQEEAKKILSIGAYNHYKRLNNFGLKVEKSNILLLGPTGSGKTLLVKTLAKIMDVPYFAVDITKYTSSGYVGRDIENILKHLFNVTGSKQRTEKGIIFIDEIDKIRSRKTNSRDVAGEAVQQELLKLIEGDVVMVDLSEERMYKNETMIDTKNILFIFGGSFSGLEEIVASRLGDKKIDLVSEKEEVLINKENILEKSDTEDFIKFGMIPEFMGRIPIRTVLRELTVDELTRILVEPENALVKQYQNLLDCDNVTLSFDKRALKKIAEVCKENGTGARGLKSVLERALLDYMFNAPYEQRTKIKIKSQEIK